MTTILTKSWCILLQGLPVLSYLHNCADLYYCWQGGVLVRYFKKLCWQNCISQNLAGQRQPSSWCCMCCTVWPWDLTVSLRPGLSRPYQYQILGGLLGLRRVKNGDQHLIIWLACFRRLSQWEHWREREGDFCYRRWDFRRETDSSGWGEGDQWGWIWRSS